MTARRLAAGYFLLQGLLVGAWWALLLARPELRRAFQVPGSPPADLLAFLPPDLVLAGGGSLAAAWLCRRGGRRARAVAWLVAGAVDYAALYCVALWMGSGTAWAGAVLMVPAAVLSTFFAASVDGDAPLS